MGLSAFLNNWGFFMQLKKKHPQDMKVLLATKGREQSDMGKSFVMSEGTQEKNVHVSHDMDECMNLVCKENFDIVIVGLDFSEKKGTTFIQRLRTLDQYFFTPILAGGNLTQPDLCILLQNCVRFLASKPLTYEGFSEKYKQLLNYEMNLSERDQLIRKSQELMRKGS